MESQEVTVSPDLLEKLRRVGTCSATHTLVNLGIHTTFMIGVRPLALKPGQTMVGRATTVRFLPLREDLAKTRYADRLEHPHFRALDAIEPGEVMVVDAGGSLEAGVGGDMYGTRIAYRGAAGWVVDGVLRDVGGIREIGLPVFTKGVHGAGIPRALMSVGWNEPIQCGGVTVVPGDILLGDENGVVVIPPHLVEEVVRVGLEHEEHEQFTKLRLQQGGSLAKYYPMDAEALAEYAEWRKTHPVKG